MKKTLLFFAMCLSLAMAATAQTRSRPDSATKAPIQASDTTINANTGLLSWNDLLELNEILLDNPKVTPRAHEIIMGWLQDRYKRNYQSAQQSIMKLKIPDPFKK